MRSDAPRVSDVQSLSVTIFNDQLTPTYSAPEVRSRSSSKRRKRLSERRQSPEQCKRKRSSSEDNGRHSRSVEQTKSSSVKTSKTADVPRQNGRKSASSGVEINADDSSDESSVVSGIRKRLSRTKTVRMYRTVKQPVGKTDDYDDDNSDDDGRDHQSSRPGSKAAMNGTLENKKLTSYENKRSTKQSSAVRGSGESRKAKEASDRRSGSRHGSQSKQRSSSSSRKGKQKSAKLSDRKRRKNKL